jgi:hypothetical protein
MFSALYLEATFAITCQCGVFAEHVEPLLRCRTRQYYRTVLAPHQTGHSAIGGTGRR